MTRPGIFYGVGVGPGDPELITLKAIRVISSAAVLAIPKSEGGAESQALAIVNRAMPLDGKETLELSFPMTKDSAALDASRRQAAALIAERLCRGQDVAFITLGDPLLYSTFSYLMPFVKELSPDTEIRAVPGITSFSAAASLIPAALAETDSKVIIIPAAYDLDRVKEALSYADTVVILKVNRAIDKLIDLIADAGLSKSSFFVSRAGWPQEEVVTNLEELRGKKPDYFSMLIVRKNV